MKSLLVYSLGLVLMVAVAATAADDSAAIEPADTTELAATNPAEAGKPDQLVVYYLHGNRRCATCRKLEAYSNEAVTTGFAEGLADSSVIWRVVNFEQEGNEHYAKDYELYTQSLVLSEVHGGTEKEWKNLDMIWKLVGDKEKFIDYVQTEIREMMKPAEED
jgi:hypothetical protein